MYLSIFSPIYLSNLTHLFVSPPLVFYTAYGASKQALECWSNSLYHEVKPFGINVITINPAYHLTNILMAPDPAVIQKEFEHLPMEVQEEYGLDYFINVEQERANEMKANVWDPINVVNAMVHAATAEHHRRQYIVGMDGRFSHMAYRMLPKRTFNWILNFLPSNMVKPAKALGQTITTKDDEVRAYRDRLERGVLLLLLSKCVCAV